MLYPYGIIGLLVLILDIYVIYLIVSSHGDPGIKLLWIILVSAASRGRPNPVFRPGPGETADMIVHPR